MGMFLFSCNTSRSTFSILNRIGISVAYSTTKQRLDDLGSRALNKLHIIADLALAGKAFFCIIYDNINKHLRAWNQTIDNENHVQNGTAGTMVMLEDVEDGALDLKEYHERCEAKVRQKLTMAILEDDIEKSRDELERAGVGMVIRILTQHVTSLSPHTKAVEKGFQTRWSVFRLRLRKTTIHPLQTTAIDESSTRGNGEVVRDFLLRQLGMLEEKIAKFIWIFRGDQLSVGRLRFWKLYNKENTKRDDGFFFYKWILPLAELWHTKWAFLRCMFRVHWKESLESEAHGLSQDARYLQRKINPKECDFYPAHRLVDVRFRTMVLGAARYVISQFLNWPLGRNV